MYGTMYLIQFFERSASEQEADQEFVAFRVYVSYGRRQVVRSRTYHLVAVDTRTQGEVTRAAEHIEGVRPELLGPRQRRSALFDIFKKVFLSSSISQVLARVHVR